MHDGKRIEPLGRDRFAVEGCDAGQRRRLLADGAHEPLQGLGLPLDDYLDAPGGVAHPSHDVVFLRQAVDVGPKPDPLHHTADGHAASDGHHDLPFVARSSNHAIHASIPAPVVHETWKMAMSGLRLCTRRQNVSMSNGT